MSAPVRLALEQGTPAWLEARRSLVTATDIAVLLGLSPWKCEADLADEKLHGRDQESNLRMRRGSFLQPFVAAEYERETGRRTRQQHGMVRHPVHEWAAASLDAVVIGERRLVEIKTSGSRGRWADGVPQDVEAQVAWQLGVSGYSVADVALLTDDALTVYEVAADAALFADLVSVAEDFRARLAAGGPFARDAARVRRDHPADDGSEIEADVDTAEAVRALIDTRNARKRLEADEERLETAIQARMADAAVMTGQGFRITWKRTKDGTATDWKALGAEITTAMPETERAALVGRFTTVRSGFRPFRVVQDKEDAS